MQQKYAWILRPLVRVERIHLYLNVQNTKHPTQGVEPRVLSTTFNNLKPSDLQTKWNSLTFWGPPWFWYKWRVKI